MDHPARKRQRKLADQDRGRFRLAGAFPFAAPPARQRSSARSSALPESRKSDLLDAVFHAGLAAFEAQAPQLANVIKQADGRDTRDCIDASHPKVWRPAADGAPVLDQADRPQNWLIGARRPANLATCRPAPDSPGAINEGPQSAMRSLSAITKDRAS
jgi:hypothetical protein